MIWRFSDGTTVELGGNVDGDTVLAQRLRQKLKGRVLVDVWPPPGGALELNANDPALLDAWLRHELDVLVRLRDLKVTLKRPQGIPDLPPPPWASDEPGDPNVIH